MTAITFTGFDCFTSAVAADGSSPVDGTGLVDITQVLQYTVSNGYSFFANQGIAGTAVGVVSDTAQAFVGPPGRQPLVIQSSAKTPSTYQPVFGYQVPTSATSIYGMGVRLRFSASSKATLVDADVPVCVGTMMAQGWKPDASSQTVLTYNPTSQLLKTPDGKSLVMPLDSEFYLEINYYTPNATIGHCNVLIDGSRLGTIQNITATNAGYGGLPRWSVGACQMVTGDDDYFRIAVGDFHLLNNSSALGPVVIPFLKFDTVTQSGMALNGTDTNLADAMADMDDTTNSLAMQASGPGTINFSFSKMPDGIDGSPIQAMPIVGLKRSIPYRGMLKTVQTLSGSTNGGSMNSFYFPAGLARVPSTIITEGSFSTIDTYTMALKVPTS